MIIFQREIFNYLKVCFTQRTLFFQKSLFSIADLFAMHCLWVVCSVCNSAQQTFTSLGLFMFASIASLLQPADTPLIPTLSMAPSVSVLTGFDSIIV